MSASTRFRHIRGPRALATLAVGLAAVGLGGSLVSDALGGADGPIFVALAGAGCLAGGLAVATAPWRVVTEAFEAGIRIGWMFGRRFVPWAEIRRVLIGPLGTGKERDPTAVTLLLQSGEEILFATLGGMRPEDHEAAKAFAEVAERAGVKVENVLAPPKERQDRERSWREARKRGAR